MVRVMDKVEPGVGERCLGIAERGQGGGKLTSGRHLRTRDRDSERLVGYMLNRHALNLSCENAELLYAAFWTHCG